MKRVLLIISALLLFGMPNLFSATFLNFNVGFDDNSPIIFDYPKTPITVPIVSQEDNVLTFKANHEDFTLQLYDENDLLVYSVYVPSSQTTVTLPTWLSGSYELRLYPDDSYIYFYGYVVF